MRAKLDAPFAAAISKRDCYIAQANHAAAIYGGGIKGNTDGNNSTLFAAGGGAAN